jgi:hypothetical protein
LYKLETVVCTKWLRCGVAKVAISRLDHVGITQKKNTPKRRIRRSIAEKRTAYCGEAEGELQRGGRTGKYCGEPESIV